MKNNLSKPIRQSNLELLRVISILMVIALHYLNHGKATDNINNLSSVNYYFVWIMRALSMGAVNIFVLISGYFLINSKFKLKKLMLLWIEVFFYSISIYIIFLLVGFIEFNLNDLLNCLTPIINNVYWFITVYIVLYILTPFINIGLKAMTEVQMRKLCIVLIIIFTVWPIIPRVDGLDVTRGYSIIQFVFLYIISAYIRLHYKRKINKYIYLITYIIISICLVLAIVIPDYYGMGRILGGLYSYNSITIVMSSIMLFLFFKELRIENKYSNKIINTIAPLTFGVYIIHEHPILKREFLYNKILKTHLFWESNYFIIIAIASIIIIYLICIFIDLIRQYLFSRFEMSIYFRRIYNFINSVIDKVIEFTSRVINE